MTSEHDLDLIRQQSMRLGRCIGALESVLRELKWSDMAKTDPVRLRIEATVRRTLREVGWDTTEVEK